MWSSAAEVSGDWLARTPKMLPDSMIGTVREAPSDGGFVYLWDNRSIDIDASLLPERDDPCREGGRCSQW